MTKIWNRFKKYFLSNFKLKNVLLCILLASEIIFVTDVLFTFSFRIVLPVLCVPIGFVLLFILLLLLPLKSLKPRIIISITLPVIMILGTVLSYYAIYVPFKSESKYEEIPCSSVDFFSNRKCMLIVPHEDDDLNLTSGIIENYLDCGSELYPVFVTNGDYFGLGEERINESIECWKYIGVPEENIYFLGYGDHWDSEGKHIYNSEADKPLTSYIGKKETYGTTTHPAYHNGNLYTNRNYRNDLKELVLEVKPDTIFISDYDIHCDHIAVSLLAETVIGEILKTTEDYHPIVYKGFAYSTAWYAPEDFYSLNALSTKEPNEILAYNWEDRVRFPVSTKSLSRSVFTTSVFNELSFYESQMASPHATRIVNSDKVFWQRRTDSLLNKADVRVSSGNVSFLSDFKILESNDVNAFSKHSPYDGVWIPENHDTEKKIEISFEEKSNISQIVLYDHPSLSDNINNIVITFDDGSSIETGKLNQNGSATVISVNKKNVGYFNLKILSSEGDNAGISEIEAFNTTRQDNGSFIKLMNENQDFIYDFFTGEEEIKLLLYSNNDNIPELSEDNYMLSCDNEHLTCNFVNNSIIVNCPSNECGIITITEKSSGLSDTVKVSHLSIWKRMSISFAQYIEDYYIYPFDQDAGRITDQTYSKLTIYRFFGWIKSLVS